MEEYHVSTMKDDFMLKNSSLLLIIVHGYVRRFINNCPSSEKVFNKLRAGTSSHIFGQYFMVL